MIAKFWLRIDRWLSGNGFHRFIIPGVLAIGAFLAVWGILELSIIIRGYFGFEKLNFAADSCRPIGNIGDAAFFYLFTNGGQNSFPGHPFIGNVITLLGILILAIVTSAMTNYFEKRADGYLSGSTAYRLENHLVILGSNDVIYSIINQYCRKCKYLNGYILVQTNRDVRQTRNEVFSFLDKRINRDNIIFIYGDRTSPEDLSKLNLPSANEIFIIGDGDEGKEDGSYRDAYNMDCVNEIARILNASKKTGTIPCHVLFEYQTTFSAFQFAGISEDIRKHLFFKPFNLYETWAQKILINGKSGYNAELDSYKYTYKFPDTIETVDAEQNVHVTYISETSDETVHLIIVGMSKMGIALAIEAAHILHFPNYVRDSTKRSRITFIDANADTEKDFFMGRFKELFRLSRHRYIDAEQSSESEVAWIEPEEDWLDVEWEFIKGRIEQAEVQQYIADASAVKTHTVTLAICLPLSHEAIAAALYLPESVYDDCLQILVYQKLSAYIVNNIAEANGNKDRYRNLRPFGMIDEGYDADLDCDDKAKRVAYVYDSYDDITKKSDTQFQSYNAETYQNEWEAKQVSDRWSSRFNANTISLKLRSISCTEQMDNEQLSGKIEDNLTSMAAVEHNRWNIEKILTGFRALTSEESLKIANLRKLEGPWYDEYKSLKRWPTRAHLDLCSNEELAKVHPENYHYDVDLTRAIAHIHSQSDTKI